MDSPGTMAKSKTHSEDVYHRVRVEILACRYRPGARLKIHELCDEHNVSNGAVREALSRLASEGLVLIEPQRGFRVMELSRDALIDLTEARIQIETICLRLAIANRNVDWETSIVGSFYRLSKIGEREPTDPLRLSEKWAEAHAIFHESLVAACPVKHLLRIRTQLYEQSERYRRISVPLRRVDRDVDKEHSQIKDAVLAGEVAVVDELMRRHLSLTTQILLDAQSFDDDGDGPIETIGAQSSRSVPVRIEP
jgi:DNA-binding GntR family transcriptional regulator